MDEVDKQIVKSLQTDGRATLEEMAKATGFTSMGVKKRLQKLIDQNVVKTQALVNPSATGLLPALVMLEMADPKATQDVLARFQQCPRVVYMFKTMGGFNLIAVVVAENQDTLASISSEECSMRSCPGIRRSEFYPIGETLYAPFLPIRENLATHDKTTAPCGVDCAPCPRFQAKECVGCPATSNYKGTL
jgi:DNA-binding Lrp family transcriptional regulator